MSTEYGKSWGSSDFNVPLPDGVRRGHVRKKMKISVKVKAGARQAKVEKVAEGQYKVWVKAPADKGKANEAVVEGLSEHLKVSKSRIEILSGHTSSQKKVEIEGL